MSNKRKAKAPFRFQAPQPRRGATTPRLSHKTPSPLQRSPEQPWWVCYACEEWLRKGVAMSPYFRQRLKLRHKEAPCGFCERRVREPLPYELAVG